MILENVLYSSIPKKDTHFSTKNKTTKTKNPTTTTTIIIMIIIKRVVNYYYFSLAYFITKPLR
jgi:hypothetical protein